jgi:hypothetical protein
MTPADVVRFYGFPKFQRDWPALRAKLPNEIKKYGAVFDLAWSQAVEAAGRASQVDSSEGSVTIEWEPGSFAVYQPLSTSLLPCPTRLPMAAMDGIRVVNKTSARARPLLNSKCCQFGESPVADVRQSAPR